MRTVSRPGRDDIIHADIHADACASWFQIKRIPIFNNMLSPGSIAHLRSLISRSVHETTPVANVRQYSPTRLLDVGLDTGNVRLITTESLQKLEYSAMSYCWGKEEANQQLKTTKRSISDHLANINMANLTQAVADAIKLCQALNIKYLWVDALCIIQDNREDWAKEAAEMANIYANSLVTLCILQGDSCLDGFLERRHSPLTLQLPFSSRLQSKVKGRLFLRMGSPPSQNLKLHNPLLGPPVSRGLDVPERMEFGSAVDNPSWLSRGWTFQEAIVSSRKLYIGTASCYFSCGSFQRSMDGTPCHDFLTKLEAHDGPRGRLSVWYAYVEKYCLRELSYEKDRLPAISAIAGMIAQEFPGEEYLAGLWKSDLARGLLWTGYVSIPFVEYLPPLNNDYIAPSWSWARRHDSVAWVAALGTAYPSSTSWRTNSGMSRSVLSLVH